MPCRHESRLGCQGFSGTPKLSGSEATTRPGASGEPSGTPRRLRKRTSKAWRPRRSSRAIIRLVTAPPTDPLDFRGVRHAYDEVARDYAAYLPDTRPEAQLDLAMIDAFAEAVTSSDDAQILDAGCGAGRMSRYLADRGCDVQGVDLSPGMVAMARGDHGDLQFTVGSLTDLPYPGGRFTGVMLWYSIIHTPPAGLPRIFAETIRVLRAGGHVIVGFQSGEGTRDVSQAYRRFGHEIELERHLHTPEHVASTMEAAGLGEVSRLVRRGAGNERDDQAVLLARAE